VREGSFNYLERESDEEGRPEKIAHLRTYWLIGRSNIRGGGGGDDQANGGPVGGGKEADSRV